MIKQNYQVSGNTKLNFKTLINKEAFKIPSNIHIKHLQSIR